jgi:hypothetical protein
MYRSRKPPKMKVFGGFSDTTVKSRIPDLPQGVSVYPFTIMQIDERQIEIPVSVSGRIVYAASTLHRGSRTMAAITTGQQNIPAPIGCRDVFMNGGS